MEKQDSNATGFGITLGSVIAVVLSFERNHSILLAAVHAIFSWAYVVYFILSR